MNSSDDIVTGEVANHNVNSFIITLSHFNLYVFRIIVSNGLI